MSAEYDKQMADSEIVFTAISTSDFDDYEQAQQAVCLFYVPDMSFSRAGISHALKRLETFYKGRSDQSTEPKVNHD